MTGLRPEQHEIRDIRTCDQQDQTHGAEKHQERWPNITESLLNQRCDFNTSLFIGNRILLLKRMRNDIHLCLSLGNGDSLAKTSENGESSRAAIAELLEASRQRGRGNPKFCAVVETAEAARHHTDNRVVGRIQHYLLA